MEMEKLSYPDALESLAKKAGIPIKYQDGYKPEENQSKILNLMLIFRSFIHF